MAPNKPSTVPVAKKAEAPGLSVKPEARYVQAPPFKWIIKAKALHAEYVQLRDEYVKWASDETRANTLYIAQWCRALVKSDKDRYGDRVSSALSAFEWQYGSDSAAMRRRYEFKCKELVELMGHKEFQAEFAQLSPDAQDNVYAELVERVGESEVGRGFFAVELKTPTSLLMTTVFKSSRKANTAFWRVLAETGATITLLKGQDAVEFIEKLLIEKSVVLQPKLVLAQLDLYPSGSIVQRRGKTVTIFVSEKVTLNAHFSSQRVFIGQAFDALNLALALYMLNEKQGAKEIVASVGALAGLLDKFRKSTDTLLKMGLAKAGGKATTASVLAIVVGVCEAITGSIDAHNRWTKGDINASVAYGSGAAAGAASAIGAGLMIWGAGTSWAGVGVALLVGGALVSLTSLVAGFFLDDNPLELWVSNCRFGEDYGKNSAYRSWVNNPQEQIKALHDAITGVEFDTQFKSGAHQVTVRPGLMLTCSKVTITVQSSWSLGVMCQYRDTPVDKRWSVQVDGDRVTSFVVHVSQPPYKDLIFEKINIELNVDAYNDGKTLLYTRKASLTPSLTERVSNWF